MCIPFVATGLLQAEVRQAYLVENGKAHAEIVVAPKAPRTVQMAARELQLYVRKISNAELPIVTTKNEEVPVHIYLGRSVYTDKLGVTNEGLKDGAFRMVSGADWLVFLGGDVDFQPKEPWAHQLGDEKRMYDEWDAITGEHFGNPYLRFWRRVDRKTGLWEYDLDNAGSFNAVNRFLRDLGVRWYMPGELGEVVPTLTSIELPKVNKTVKPDFPYRDIYVYGSNFFSGKEDLIMWQMRLGLNQGLNIFGCIPDTAFVHGLEALVIRDEMKVAHPDFYKLEGGERLTKRGIPCLSSEELLQANVRYLRALFDHYDIKVASVMPTDGFMSLCACEKCKGKSNLERGANGQLSDYVWGYVNRVAKEIYKTHPDRKIQCAAYSSYLLPPENIDKLPPNVVVGIATELPKTSEFYKKLIRDWQKKISPGVQIYQYDYYIHNAIPGTPWQGVPTIFPQTIVENLRDTKGISIGNYIEVSPNILNDINAFVAARFLWDANQDLRAMMEEYYRLFYGPASEQMKAFVEFSEAHYMKMPENAEDIERAFDLIHIARKAAGETIYGKRIDQIISFMEPMKKTREQLLTAHQNAQKFKAARADNTPQIALDGKLDEAFWQNIPAYSLTDIETKKKAKSETSVKLRWSGNFLYVGIQCEEPLIAKLSSVNPKNGDMWIWEYDNIEVFIKTQYRSYYQIAVNPNGAFLNVDWSAKSMNTLWASGVEVATSRGKNSWTVEMRLPVSGGNIDVLNGIIGICPTEKSPWYFNIGRLRTIGGKREVSSISGSAFRDINNFGELTVE